MTSRPFEAPLASGALCRLMALSPVLLAAFLLGISAAARAQIDDAGRPAAPPPIESRPLAARTLVLAKLMLPEDLIVEQEMALAKGTFEAAVPANPRARRLEAAHPGLYAAIWAEVEPELRRLASEGKPILWTRVAARLETLLTANETEALIAFYSTSIGRRILRVAIAAIDSYPDDSRPPAPPERQVVAARVRELGEIGAEDRSALAAASRIVGGDKLRAIGEEVQKVARAWRLESEPGRQAQGDAIIAAALGRQLARRRARR